MTGMRDGYAAVGRLYHAWITGLILLVVTRRGSGAATEFVFRLFRRQQREKFLPGLAKLGLEGLPAAVASAQYHYLSNRIGGVKVEYIPESDRKAWIRYPAPRWIWQGTAICAVPSEVSLAMLRGWHAQNGLSLGNPRLGFVCTKQTVDGADALEGYFLEYDHALQPEERLRLAPGEEAPLFDPALAPGLPGSWTPERLAKAARNYAIEYVRSAVPELVALFGAEEATFLGSRSAYLVGLQFTDEIKALLGVAGTGADGFAQFFCTLAAAQGDGAHSISDGAAVVIRHGPWRLLPQDDGVGFAMWNALWQGALAAHDRTLCWSVTARDSGGIAFRIAPVR
jgi:hypothetical protein